MRLTLLLRTMSLDDMKRELHEKFEKLSGSTQTIGEWLDYMGSLERSLSPKQLSYLIRDPYYQAVVEAIDYQIEHAPYVRDFLTFPTSDFRMFRYFTPSINATIGIRPEQVEEIIRFWSDTENVIKAELAIAELNKEIAQRTFYGGREQLAPADGHVLAWSNSAERWIVFARKYRKGDPVTPTRIGLDANMIYAPYDLEFLHRIVPHLDPLPLFMLSLEAKERRRVSPEVASFYWRVLQHIRLREEEERKKYR